MKYSEIPDNSTCQFSWHNIWRNFYFEKKDGLVYVYYRKAKAGNFELCLVEKMFYNIDLLLEIKDEDKEIDDEYENSLPFDTGCRKAECKYDEEIEKQIAKLREELCRATREPNCCYILIQYKSGQACIKEILSNRIVAGYFDINDYKLVYKHDWHPHDCIIRFQNRDKKSFALFSLKRGYIWGPFIYQSIEEYHRGVIIDEKYVIEYSGYVKDIFGYERIEGKYVFDDIRHDVFIKKESNSCYILLDAYCLMPQMEMVELKSNDEVHNNIFELELGKITFTFNANTKELTVDDSSERDDWTDEDAWDAMTDGAYGDYPGPGWDPEHLGF